MARKTRSSIRIMLLTGLILAGFMAPAWPEEQPEPAQTPPKAGEEVKKHPRFYRNALAGLEIVADLSVTPTYNGPCPAVFTFKGKISVNRPVTLQYRFVRSDNIRHAMEILTFDEAGSKEVTKTWEFDDPAQLPSFSGWEAIQVLLPVKMQSNPAFFRGTCTDYKGASLEPQSQPGGKSAPAHPPENAPGARTLQPTAPKSLP
jgi:hypothetical protein